MSEKKEIVEELIGVDPFYALAKAIFKLTSQDERNRLELTFNDNSRVTLDKYPEGEISIQHKLQGYDNIVELRTPQEINEFVK